MTHAQAHERGRKGGLSCRDRHGREFYQRIGRLGYKATLTRYFCADGAEMRRFLWARGFNLAVDELAGRELDRRLAAGEAVVCMEVMVLEDDDLPF